MIDRLKNVKMSTLFGLLLTLILLISETYAWLTLSLTGSKNNNLRAGVLDLVLDDNMSDGISLADTVPMSDTKGLTTKAYTFTLKNNGSINSDYTIYLDDLVLDSTEKRMDDNFIKYSLVKNDGEDDPELLVGTGVNPNRILESGIIGAKATNTYTLRMWIDSAADNTVMGTIFSAQLRIEAEQTNRKILAKKDLVLNLSKSSSVQIDPDEEIADDVVSYDVSDKNIASVTDSGLVTALVPGAVTVSALDANRKVLEEYDINITKTVSVSFSTDGSAVESVGKTTEECTLDSENPEECSVVAPNITASDGYAALGWCLKDNSEVTLTKANSNNINSIKMLNYSNSSVKRLENSDNILNTPVVEIGKEILVNGNSVYQPLVEKESVLKESYSVKFYSQGKYRSTSILKNTAAILPTISSLNINYSGRVFQGWDTASSATNVVYSDGEDITKYLDGNDTIQLYAVWKDPDAPVCTFSSASEIAVGNTKSIYMTCKDNGGVVKKKLTTSDFVSSDSAKGIVTSVASPKSVTNGYKYKITMKGLSVGSFNLKVNAEIKDKTGNISVINDKSMNVIGTTYKLSLVKNGSGISLDKTSVTCTTEGSDKTCDVSLPNIVADDGYTVVGWNTDRTSTTGNKIGDKITLSKNITYYSISYRNEVTYDASFFENGSKLSDLSKKSCTIPVGYNSDSGSKTCTVSTPTITRDGYNIIGFNQDKNAKVKTLSNGGILTLSKSNTGSDWYAITSKKITAYFNANGATVSSASKSCTGYNLDESCDVTSPTISRSGYKVIGFNQNSNGDDSEWNVSTIKSLNLSGNNAVTYYAITKKTLVATWVENGASLEFASSSCDLIGTSSTCSVNTPAIVASNNTPVVVGFNTTSNATTSVVDASSVKKLSANTTYYAITKSIEKKYNVNWSANGLKISSTLSSCTIDETFNGVEQAKSCFVTTPNIEKISGRYVGFNLDKNSTKAELKINTSYELNITNTGQTWYAISSNTPSNDSLTGFIESNDFTNDSYEDVTINDESYSLHIYNFDSSQVWSISKIFGDANDVATSTDEAKNTVVVKVNGDLTIENDAVISTYTDIYGSSKGLILYVTGKLTNNSSISMDSRGAKAHGQNIYLWQNSDKSYECVPAEGATGAASITRSFNSVNSTTYVEDGVAGSNGNSRQTGGGGSGSVEIRHYNYKTVSGTAGGGSNGTSYSGGAGGGAINMNYSGTRVATSGADFGGAGGVAYARRGDSSWASRYASGGAGNPGGNGMINGSSSATYKGPDGTGGLLVIYANSIENNGIITAKGASCGKIATATGGSSGGGSINIFYKESYKTSSELDSSGGISVTSGVTGGNGGNGTSTICSIKTGSCIK